MNFEEFSKWLQQEVAERRMLKEQMEDLLQQRQLFDNNRGMLQSEYHLRVVGYVAEKLQVADTASVLLQQAKITFPTRMMYFEPVGYRAYL